MRLDGARFLDIFSGSGIMSLEALSRGCSFALAIESNVRQCREIQDNFRAFNLTPAQAKAIPMDARSLLKKACNDEPFDFIFLDPPYGFKDLDVLAEQCLSNGWIKPEGVILIEHSNRDPVLEGYIRKEYGDSALSIRDLANETD